jgi:hypothetical protein
MSWWHITSKPNFATATLVLEPIEMCLNVMPLSLYFEWRLYVWSERNTKTPEAFDLTLIFCNLIPAIFSMRSLALIFVVLAGTALYSFAVADHPSLWSRPLESCLRTAILSLRHHEEGEKKNDFANEESIHKSSQWPLLKKLADESLFTSNWNIRHAAEWLSTNHWFCATFLWHF